MEHDINQVIELIHDNETVKLKIVEQDDCEQCFFFVNHKFGKNAPCMRHEYHIADYYCSKIFRSDGKSVIYKKIK